MADKVESFTQIIIRDFKIGDYDRLIELWCNSKLPHKPAGRDSKKNIAREIERGNSVFLIAEKDGILVGSAFGTHDGRKGWINRVAVATHYQRQGIAERLVNEIEHRLDGLGIRIIACLIEEWNRDSMKFFEKLGYRRHNDIYYFTKRQDADV